jgi:glyoxylase-like metal-dependent hydrolase (beta-lactamase superfamily II)
VLFSGDTFRIEDGKVTGAPKHYTWDETKEKESIKKAADLDFDFLLPGHADYLKGNASSAAKAFAKQ